MEPEIVVDCACKTGENPLWHSDEGRIYWTDIPNGRLYRWDPHGTRRRARADL
jgi:D-xylono/L-arabinono-1,4-lactonase